MYSKEDKRRDSYYKRTYGISLSQYNSLRRKQHYSCPICLRSENVLKRRLVVEHDHKTGYIYGLVCDYCNRFVIGRIHSLDIARRLVAYLEKHTGWQVPKRVKRKRKKK